MTYKLDSLLFGTSKTLPIISTVDHYAGHEKLIIKSLETQNLFGGTFDITFDLEDGASVGQESALRQLFKNVVHSELNQHKKLGVRIHDAESEHFLTDLQFMAKECGTLISHLTVPKIEDAASARKIIAAIESEFKQNNVNVPPVHFLIETIHGVRDVFAIAALPYLRGLDFGCMDYVSGFLGAIHASAMSSPMQFEHPMIVKAKIAIVEACVAHGIIPSHNVCVDYKDPEVAFNDALIAKNNFGFMRMWSIHPNQIKPIQEAFTPEASEVTSATQILLAGQKANWAPIAHLGKLHDRASYRYYWSLLKQAKSSGMTLSSDTATLLD